MQGIMLAMRVREKHPGLPITETHPKALLLALKLGEHPPRPHSSRRPFVFLGDEPADEHRRDALLSAVAAREGEQERWRDLSVVRCHDELDPKQLWFGPVKYWWPHGDDTAAGRKAQKR